MFTDHDFEPVNDGGSLGGPGGNTPAPAVGTQVTQRAFSMVEILVVVALLSVIIIGLLAMFSQTQRALMVVTTQVDYLESGRAATEMLARELEQVAPANLDPFFGAFNLLTDPSTSLLPNIIPGTPPFWRPTGTNELTENNLQKIFFLSRYNQQWKATAYFIDTANPPTPTSGGQSFDSRLLGVGTLYRFETNATLMYPSNSLATIAQNFFNFQEPWVSDKTYLVTNRNGVNLTKVVDGVVHFRIKAYDTNGFLITRSHTFTNVFDRAGRVAANINVHSNNFAAPNGAFITDYYYSFASNAVPAYLEVELGVLEDRVLEHFYSLTNNPTSAYNYLANHSAQMHMFRQRIAVRNVDPAAYQ